jgi:hypothetical protein
VLTSSERRETLIDGGRVELFSHSEKKSTRRDDSPPSGHRRGRIGARRAPSRLAVAPSCPPHAER